MCDCDGGRGGQDYCAGVIDGVHSPDKDERPAERAGGDAPRGTKQDGAGSMKPRWTRFRKKRKQTDPEGVLQAGVLVFSATCGATLLLAACNGG